MHFNTYPVLENIHCKIVGGMPMLLIIKLKLRDTDLYPRSQNVAAKLLVAPDSGQLQTTAMAEPHTSASHNPSARS